MFAVALYARAWVEMAGRMCALPSTLRRPLREGVGRNSPSLFLLSLILRRRPLREGVGRNYFK